MNASTGESGEGNATVALRSHLVSSKGTEHGPRYEFPSVIEATELAEYVDRAVAGSSA